PTQVVVSADELDSAAQAIEELDGVESMSVTTEDSPSGTATVTADGEIEAAPSQGPPTGDSAASPEPTTVEGQEMLGVALSAAVRPLGDEARVAGDTAGGLDTNISAEADRSLAIPLTLLVLTIILIVLLRPLLAPLRLVALTVLSCGTALGVSALVFNHLSGV